MQSATPKLSEAETRELAQIAMRQRIEEQSAAATRRHPSHLWLKLVPTGLALDWGAH